MNDLEKLLSKLAEESDRIIASKETIEATIAKGVRFDQVPERTLEESVDLLFTQRMATALEIAKKLPVPPRHAPPAISSLYDEIRQAIIFGLNGAAITLCGIMVEFTLKFVTYHREVGGSTGYDPGKWDEFESITMGRAIDRAKKANLLNDAQVAELRKFKDASRNPYNHYNIRKITSGVVWQKVKVVNIHTASMEERDIAAKDNPVIQAQAKPYVDAATVLYAFEFGDSVVKQLLSQLP